MQEENANFVSYFKYYLENEDEINKSEEKVLSFIDKLEILANDCEDECVYSEYLFLCGYVSWSFITSSLVGSDVLRICERGKSMIDEAYEMVEDEEYLIFKVALTAYHMYFVNNYSDMSKILDVENDYPNDIEKIEESFFQSEYLSLVPDKTFERIYDEFNLRKTQQNEDNVRQMLLRHNYNRSDNYARTKGLGRLEEQVESFVNALTLSVKSMTDCDNSISNEELFHNCIEELLKVIMSFEARIEEISKSRLLLELFIDEELGDNCKVKIGCWKKFVEAFIRWKIFGYGVFLDDSDFDLIVDSIEEAINGEYNSCDVENEQNIKNLADFTQDEKNCQEKEFLIFKGLVLFRPFYGGLDASISDDTIRYIKQARYLLENIDDKSLVYNEESLNFISKNAYLHYYEDIDKYLNTVYKSR